MNYLFQKSFLVLLITGFVSCSGDKRNKEEKQQSQDQTANESTAANVNNEGENLYLRYCMACHQTDGSGVPGMYPPITKSPIVNSGKKEDFINILLNGLKGPIVVHGKTYNQQMPKQDFLSNKDLAKIINYVNTSFENKAPEVTPDDIKALRKKTSE